MSSESKQSFKQALGSKELAFFNELAKKSFSDQAVAFLNAYWAEVGSQADFIFNVSWRVMKETDMHYKGVEYIHLYEEGINLDFDAGLYFFEKLCKYCDDQKNEYCTDEYADSMPVMMTSIVRKKELRNKVDVNFDGRVSFIEFLLYQYQAFANPASFCERAMAVGDEPADVRAARLALIEVQKLINKYEAKKMALEKKSKKKGIKGLTAKNELAQLASSPEAEALNRMLITAEAKVRIVSRKYKGKSVTTGGTKVASGGAVWWLEKDLKEKKRRRGGK